MNALIVPVYKNEESIVDLLSAVGSIGKNFPNQFTAVFVDDGSPDKCSLLLEELLPTMVYPSRLIRHSRNFGSFAAIRSGLQKMEATNYAVMAADLQEPCELIIDMFNQLSSHKADVVIGSRNSRKDLLLSRICANLFWNFYRKHVVREIPKGGVDIFGCNRRVRDILVDLHEANSSLIGQLFWIGFARSVISYDRRARAKGKSAWTLPRQLDYLMDSIFAFTDLPIKVLLGAGFLGASLSLIFGVAVVLAKFFGQIPVPGYAATILTIIFFGTLNIFVLGIIGTYAHRTYENTKGRPYSIVLNERFFKGTQS